MIASGVTPPDELGPLPEEWIVRPRLPQVAALRACDVVVCHGGNNTVMEALAAGLPVVALLFSTDQFAVAADVEAAGLGVAVDPNRATAVDLTATVRLALRSGPRRRASTLGRSFGATPAPPAPRGRSPRITWRLAPRSARRRLLCDRRALAILVSFVVALAVNAAFFAIAATRKTDVVTDLSYSLSFAVLAIVLPFLGAHEPIQLAASLLVLVWAARLGVYLFRRILRIKVDHRFDGMRDNPLRFARFWLLQAISVAVIMLPVSYLLGRDIAPGFGLWMLAGATIWAVGLVIESVADAQKSAFKAWDENRGGSSRAASGGTPAP